MLSLLKNIEAGFCLLTHTTALLSYHFYTRRFDLMQFPPAYNLISCNRLFYVISFTYTVYFFEDVRLSLPSNVFHFMLCVDFDVE